MNESSIGTWVFKIASNICLRQIQKSKRMIKVLLPFQIEDKREEANDEQVKFLYDRA